MTFGKVLKFDNFLTLLTELDFDPLELLNPDPNSNKCKFLPLGRWRRELTQADIPTPYMKITNSLDMVGVKLCATWSSSRVLNCDIVKYKVKQLIGSWRAGKFMPLSQRSL